MTSKKMWQYNFPDNYLGEITEVIFGYSWRLYLPDAESLLSKGKKQNLGEAIAACEREHKYFTEQNKISDWKLVLGGKR